MAVTNFKVVYDCFFSKITDDMYMEMDERQTEEMLEELLLNAIPWFEFPRVDLTRYNLYNNRFEGVKLNNDEINILATYMVVGWLDQQLASVENVRMKYSGSDFKFTSQANHMSKLLALKKDYERAGFHLQRLYKRRKVDKDGRVRSTFSEIMKSSVREGNVGGRPNLYDTTDTRSVSDEWEEMPALASGKDFASINDTSSDKIWLEMRSVENDSQDAPCGNDNSWKNM